MSITDKLSLCAGGFHLPRDNKPCAKCGATQWEPCGRSRDGWEPDVPEQLQVSNQAERLEQIRARHAAARERRNGPRSDDEADIEFLLGIIDGLSADIAGGAWVPVSEWNVTIAERDNLRNALRLILPMAKGYAHEHPVGGNQEKVNEAAEILNTNRGV